MEAGAGRPRICAHLASSPGPRGGVSCAPRGGKLSRLRADAEARGGFLMASGIRERIRASVRVLHPARAATFMAAGAGVEMKVMIFPVKYDKFTGYFDKFLKIYRIGIKIVFLIYSVIYLDNIKRIMNDLSEFLE